MGFFLKLGCIIKDYDKKKKKSFKVAYFSGTSRLWVICLINLFDALFSHLEGPEILSLLIY